MSRGYQALIVDSDVAMQRLGAHALRQQGFQCVCASDVTEAERLLSATSYDVVVTELRLPQRNGYTLVQELLKLQNRPIIVVCTDVIEARLTKDLLMRGVEDIHAKPINGAFFAGKIRALVDVRATLKTAPEVAAGATRIEPKPLEDCQLPISLAELNRRLEKLTTVLPISDAAVDVATMTRDGTWQNSHIAAAIQRDAGLTANVLKMANSSLYNVGNRPITEVDQAVARIGQHRVGELAIATSAMSGVTQEKLPWLDMNVTWKRSMAAGIALEALIEEGGHQSIDEGLLLGAIMYPLGRVALGMLFPEEYWQMVNQCQETGEALQDVERKNLPTSHVAVLAHLLASWKIGPEVFMSIKLATDDYAALSRLSDPMRARSELVKLAVLLGRIAVGKWQDFDVLDLPRPSVLKRLRISNPIKIVERTQRDLAKLAGFSPCGEKGSSEAERSESRSPVAYCNVSNAKADFVAALLPSFGLEPIHIDLASAADASQPLILNCLNARARSLSAAKLPAGARIICDVDSGASFSRIGSTVSLSSSYGRVRAALTSDATLESAAVDSGSSWVKKFSLGVARRTKKRAKEIAHCD
jgi:HD-like signal output (HDOD) protein/ActR/RegA family two-component response regulator